MSKKVEAWGNRSWNDEKPRTRLADAIPLPMPFTAAIEPTNLCNFKCRFCPTGYPELLSKVSRPKGFMDFEVFQKIIRDFQEFPEPLRALFMHKDGEPLMHPRIVEMLALAKASGIADKVWLTTNGSLLDNEKSIGIIESGTDMIRLSVEHFSAEGYKSMTQTFTDYEGLLRKVEFLYNEKERRNSPLKIWAKAIDFNFTEQEKEKFSADFGSIADEVLMTENGIWTNDVGVDFNLGVKPKAGYDGQMRLNENRVVCPYPFYSMAVNFDGSVSGCQLDWSHSLNCANVKENSLVNIWNGRQFDAIRLAFLEGRRADYLSCKGCQCAKYTKEDSELDSDRQRLAQIISNRMESI